MHKDEWYAVVALTLNSTRACDQLWSIFLKSNFLGSASSVHEYKWISISLKANAKVAIAKALIMNFNFSSTLCQGHEWRKFCFESLSWGLLHLTWLFSKLGFVYLTMHCEKRYKLALMIQSHKFVRHHYFKKNVARPYLTCLYSYIRGVVVKCVNLFFEEYLSA